MYLNDSAVEKKSEKIVWMKNIEICEVWKFMQQKITCTCMLAMVLKLHSIFICCFNQSKINKKSRGQIIAIEKKYAIYSSDIDFLAENDELISSSLILIKKSFFGPKNSYQNNKRWVQVSILFTAFNLNKLTLKFLLSEHKSFSWAIICAAFIC